MSRFGAFGLTTSAQGKCRNKIKNKQLIFEAEDDESPSISHVLASVHNKEHEYHKSKGWSLMKKKANEERVLFADAMSQHSNEEPSESEDTNEGDQNPPRLPSPWFMSASNSEPKVRPTPKQHSERTALRQKMQDKTQLIEHAELNDFVPTPPSLASSTSGVARAFFSGVTRENERDSSPPTPVSSHCPSSRSPAPRTLRHMLSRPFVTKKALRTPSRTTESGWSVPTSPTSAPFANATEPPPPPSRTKQTPKSSSLFVTTSKAEPSLNNSLGAQSSKDCDCEGGWVALGCKSVSPTSPESPIRWQGSSWTPSPRRVPQPNHSESKLWPHSRPSQWGSGIEQTPSPISACSTMHSSQSATYVSEAIRPGRCLTKRSPIGIDLPPMQLEMVPRPRPVIGKFQTKRLSSLDEVDLAKECLVTDDKGRRCRFGDLIERRGPTLVVFIRQFCKCPMFLSSADLPQNSCIHHDLILSRWSSVCISPISAFCLLFFVCFLYIGCGFCQTYVSHLASQVRNLIDSAERRGVSLRELKVVIIGNGSHTMITQYQGGYTCLLNLSAHRAIASTCGLSDACLISHQ